jgi:2-polyprenyl-6-methoxyphenol hydroxylase-like FAD-dependent oxidoreductase
MCTRVYERTQLRSPCSGASGKRGDFQHILYEAAKKRDVMVRFNCQVADVDDKGPSVTLSSGEKIEADLIVAADGTLLKYRSGGGAGSHILQASTLL